MFSAAGAELASVSVAAAWLALVVFLIARAVQQLRNYRRISVASLPPDCPRVSVIVPARNEVDSIGACLRGLLAQDYPGALLEIIVVDDQSEDGTPAEIQSIAGASERVRLIAGAGLPEGWMGKAHACWQGSRTASGDWLCFLDADTRAAPPLLRAAIATATEQGLDMLSLEPAQELGSFWERLIVPLGFLVIAVSADLGQVNDPEVRDVATANGQFLLIARRCYEAIGGHAAVASELHEDRALALRAKQRGRRIALCGADALLRVRMYRDLPSLWEGGTRNLSGILGGPGRTALTALAMFLLGGAVVLLPLWTAMALPAGGLAGQLAFGLGMAGSCALLGIHAGTLRHFRVRPVYVLLFPLGCMVAGLVGLSGAAAQRLGRLAWKGRPCSMRPRPSGP